ncbi:MAG: hypothetical protein II715_00475 [Clostridia bacterium]|nr:hypothetical protein [Clostridia bacterium]
MNTVIERTAAFLLPLVYPAGFFLLAAGILFLLKLDPSSVSEDLMSWTAPDGSLRGKVLRARAESGRKTGKGRTGAGEKFHAFLLKAQTALSSGRRNGSQVFARVCFCAVAAAVICAFLAVRIGNVFLAFPLAAFGFALPFLWVRSSMNAYRDRENAELETALSVISSSYLRSGDMLSAVKENLPSMRPPVKDAFSLFVFECSMVDADMRKAANRLRNAFPDPYFREWCDAFAACDRDRAMADMLLPVAAKMTNERLLKDELKTAVGEAKREYFVMLGLVFGNVPLLYLLNKDWFYALTDSVPGQIALALCVLAGLITFLLLGRFARLPSPKGTDARPVSGKSAPDSQNKKNKTVRKEDNA